MTSWPWRGNGVRTKQLTFEPSTICRLRCARRLMVWALTRRWTTSDAGRRFKQPSTALLLLAERSQLVPSRSLFFRYETTCANRDGHHRIASFHACRVYGNHGSNGPWHREACYRHATSLHRAGGYIPGDNRPDAVGSWGAHL